MFFLYSIHMSSNIIGKEIKVLDHGFIRVVDAMGDDSSITQAARVSYGTGTKTKSEDRSLIRYLMRHKHTSPFEMCEIKLHLKMPMCIGEQWIRHRTANVNKISGRYSILDADFYIPNLENLEKQSNINKQGREEIIDQDLGKSIQDIMLDHSQKAYENYNILLKIGVAREIARMVLPANIYTQFYWKIDLHNLLHFIRLRSHPTAQYEIRVYSEFLEDIVKEWCPNTYEAFVDYNKDSVFLSKQTKFYVSRNDVAIEGLGKSEALEFESIFGKK